VLRFRLGSFPIAVYPSFLIAAAILGPLSGDIQGILVWVVVVFLSVLTHELGHALVGKAFGGKPEIRLEGFGGVTFPRLPQPPGPGKQIALSLAGPFAGLLLGAAAWGASVQLNPEAGSPVSRMLGMFQVTSVLWAVLNLLPVLPLDGGQVLLAVLQGIRKKPSLRLASLLSGAIALAVAAASFFLLDQAFMAIWFVLFAAQNFAQTRASRTSAAEPAPAEALPPERDDVERELSRARTALIARDEGTALAAASRLEEGEGPYRQAAGLRIRAGVELARGDYTAAGLHAGRSFTLWQSPDAAVVAARANLRAGERDRALNWLRRAVEAGALPAAVREDPELGQLQR
jgi:stage IV sporulation protein FB